MAVTAAATAATAATAALAAPAALAKVVQVGPPATDPLLALWERRQQLLPLCTGDDETVDRIADLITELEEEMIKTPATTPAGLGVKMKVYESYIGELNTEYLDGRMLASLFADAKRLARQGRA